MANSGAVPGRAAAWVLPRLVLVAAALVLAACGRPASDPEVQIRAALAEVEHAAKAGELEIIARRVARDYADQAGRDRRELLLTIRGLLMRYPHIQLVVTVREIEIISPQLARVRLELLAAGAGPAGLSADAIPLELSLRDDGSGWKLTRAEWSRRLGRGI